MFGRMPVYDPIGGSNSDMLGVPEFPVRVKNMLIAPDGIDFAQDGTSYNGQTSGVGNKTYMIFGNGPNSWRLANVGGAVGMVLPGYGTNVPFVLGASTGTNHNGIVFSNLSSFGWAGSTSAMGAVDTVVARGGVANVQFGPNASATPVGQTLSVQDGSGTDIAPATWTFRASRGTGTGGGSLAGLKAFSWSTPDAGSTGAVLNTATEKLYLTNGGALGGPVEAAFYGLSRVKVNNLRVSGNAIAVLDNGTDTAFIFNGANSSRGMSICGPMPITFTPAGTGLDAASIQSTIDLYIYREAAANLRFGAAASATPVAQTLSVQDASGTNISGADWTFRASRATGTGVVGSFIWQTHQTSAASGSTQTPAIQGMKLYNTDASNFGLLLGGASGGNTVGGFFQSQYNGTIRYQAGAGGLWLDNGALIRFNSGSNITSTDTYFGRDGAAGTIKFGGDSATPQAYSFRVGNGSGTDIAPVTTTRIASLGTGTGGGSLATLKAFSWQTPDAGSTGAVLNTATEKMYLANGGALNLTQAVAAATTDGLVLATTQTATLNNQKWSPRLRMRASGWGTTGGAAQTVDYWQEVIPIQGTTSGGRWQLVRSVDGAAGTPILSDLINSYFGVSQGLFIASDVTDSYTYSILSLNTTGIAGRNSCHYGWVSSGTNANGGMDTMMGREAAANVRLGSTASATPVAQTLSVQHCSGTDIAGSEWTFTGSLATGNAVPGGFMWKMGNTSGAVSGSTQQTATQRMRLYAEDTSTTTLILGTESGLGTSCGSIRAKSNGEVRWNLHQYAFYLQSGAPISWSSGSNAMSPDTWMVRDAAANIRFGNAASATPVAQTTSVQDASGTDIAPVTWTFRASRGTGTGGGALSSLKAFSWHTPNAGTTGATLNAVTEKMYLRNDGICVFTNRIHSNADITVGTMGSFFGLYVRSTASTAGQSNTVNLAQNTELGWTSGTDASAAPDSGFSRLGAAAVALGNGTAADKTGTLSLAGVKFVEGSNARMGTATLTAGAATVSNTSVTANSRIFLTSQADGGTPGWLRVSARTASTSFTITSSSGTDTSTVAWIIYEPA